ncbi:MAG: FimB/Mfa2 family fimbrial subunit [Mediterranea sp.]|nr:FimB/Mfa2 family fimbrial subunit [Mediterranea sp.]
MRKKSFYLWSLLVVMLTMTACSSDPKEDLSAKTGTFELNFTFEGTSVDSRASTAIPETSWKSIKQIQFFLYDVNNKVVFSSIVVPGTGDTSSKTYTYTTIPVGDYTLVAVANAKNNSDSITTYISSAEQTWTEGNVFNMDIKDLSIKHKPGQWSPAITGKPETKAVVDKLKPYSEPSEVFMGYAANVKINTTAIHKSSVSLKREVSLMRVRLDQKTHTEAANVDFANNTASVLLYCIPDQMGIGYNDLGGIGTTSTVANSLSVTGAFSNQNVNSAYLDGNYSLWKDIIVFPNNGGRVNNAHTTAVADDSRKYFVVLCGITKAGHYFSGSTTEAPVGVPVFWYGQIKEVFTPNVIREVNLILKTGGSPTPPATVVEYGGLEVVVSEPEDWSSNIVVSTISM